MKIKYKFFIIIFSTLFIISLISAFIIIKTSKNEIEKLTEKHLQTTAQSRAHHIESVLGGYSDLVKMMATGNTFKQAVKSFKDNKKILASIEKRMLNAIKSHKAISILRVLDINGIIANSTNRDIGIDESHSKIFIEGKKGLYISDIHRSKITGRIVINFAHPIIKEGKTSGVLILSINAEKELFHIVQDTTGLGYSGEVYLINEKYIMVTPSRFIKNSIFIQKINLSQSYNCNKGHFNKDNSKDKMHHAGIYNDYRGVEVLGYHYNIDKLKCLLIAEIDIDESFAPIFQFTEDMIKIFLIIIFTVFLISLILSRLVMTPVLKLLRGIKEYRNGNLNFRVSTNRHDELGVLINQFNDMADSINEHKKSLELHNENLENLVQDKTKELRERAKNAENQNVVLLEQKERNLLFFKNAPLGIIFYNDKGIITEVNDAIISIFGSSKEKLIGLSIDTIPDKKFVKEVYKSLRGEFGYYEGEYTSYTGAKSSYIKADWIPIKSAEKIISGVGIVEDITKNKIVEREIFRLATVVKQADQVIVITGLDGKIEYANPAFEKITGYSISEVVGRNPRILKGGQQDKEFYKKLWNTITSGKTWHGVFYNKKKDNSFYYENAVIFPIKNSKGGIANYAAVKQDITVQKKLQDQLQQSQKMEAIGTLAGGIAHDFNNILGVIIGYTELTMDEVLDNDDLMDNLTRIISASERAKEMVEHILTFSRKNITEMTPVYLKKIIQETVKFLRASIPSTIEIKLDIDKSFGQVFANETQVNQILMNLCTNAAYAMREEGGMLEINLNNTEITPDNSIGDLEPGKYQLLQVKDSGIGIKKDILEKIFEPYFTTKRAGEGTGMGLAVAYGIIKSYRGHINVYSELDKGAVFNVYLPLIKTDETDGVEKPAEIIRQGNGESILFVDDEKDLVEVGTYILKKIGYKVEAKNSSLEALETFKTEPDKFDLLITDKTMPDMTGIKLAEKIHKIKPDLPVILCTGFSNNLGESDYENKGINALILKPINKKKMAEVIWEVLNS